MVLALVNWTLLDASLPALLILPMPASATPYSVTEDWAMAVPDRATTARAMRDFFITDTPSDVRRETGPAGQCAAAARLPLATRRRPVGTDVSEIPNAGQLCDIRHL